MENHIALYRKYRPQGFDEIIAQGHIVTTLKNAITGGSISHAYLFCGPRGSGKTTIARIFAKAINCLGAPKLSVKEATKQKQGQPCGECDSCMEITAGKSLDVIEIDAASHTGVDEVRELIDSLKFAPAKSKYKIFIVDECHQLSKSAANALLKTLEEPPTHAIFILATTESHKMIPTIVSRCQRFDFKRLQSGEITEKLEFILKKEGIKAEPAALHVIALNGRGSFRDAESLLDKCIQFSGNKKELALQEVKDILGIVEVGQISALIKLLLEKNTKEAVLYINRLAEEGVDLQEFAKTLVFYVRQLLLLKINPEFLTVQNSGLLAEELETLKQQALPLAEKNIQSMLELFMEAENKMKYSSIMQLPLELAIVTLTTG